MFDPSISRPTSRSKQAMQTTYLHRQPEPTYTLRSGPSRQNMTQHPLGCFQATKQIRATKPNRPGKQNSVHHGHKPLRTRSTRVQLLIPAIDLNCCRPRLNITSLLFTGRYLGYLIQRRRPGIPEKSGQFYRS